MPICEHATEFFDRPVVEFDPERGLENPGGLAHRVRLDWDDSDAGARMADVLDALLGDPAIGRLEALVIGDWGHAAEGHDASLVVEKLVAARERLPALRALFFGDIVSDEAAISAIVQTDLSPLWAAFPELVELRVRGAAGLALGTPRHERLEALIVESAGLGAGVVRGVSRAELPRLRHLELWLGTAENGGDATVDDLAPILDGERFPELRFLGICNAERADSIAVAVARAPLLERLEELDLSLGTLSDEGAGALLDSPAVKRLRRLQLHHHYVSDGVAARLRALGIEVDIGPRVGSATGGEARRQVAVAD